MNMSTSPDIEYRFHNSKSRVQSPVPVVKSLPSVSKSPKINTSVIYGSEKPIVTNISTLKPIKMTPAKNMIYKRKKNISNLIEDIYKMNYFLLTLATDENSIPGMITPFSLEKGSDSYSYYAFDFLKAGNVTENSKNNDYIIDQMDDIFYHSNKKNDKNIKGAKKIKMVSNAKKYTCQIDIRKLIPSTERKKVEHINRSPNNRFAQIIPKVIQQQKSRNKTPVQRNLSTDFQRSNNEKTPSKKTQNNIHINELLQPPSCKVDLSHNIKSPVKISGSGRSSKKKINNAQEKLKKLKKIKMQLELIKKMKPENHEEDNDYKYSKTEEKEIQPEDNYNNNKNYYEVPKNMKKSSSNGSSNYSGSKNSNANYSSKKALYNVIDSYLNNNVDNN